MISKKEYEVLCALLESRPLNIEKNVNELDSLRRDKLIKLHNVMYKNIDNILDFGYDGFEVTQDGIRAIEEYETLIKTEQRNNETLTIAKKANELSTESNHIAKSANKISFIAIGISLVSIVVSVLLAIFL